MNNTDELLQELVDLKHEELKKQSHDRWIKFFLKILPSFVLTLIMIYGTIILFKQTQNLMENFPEIINNILESQQNDFFNNIEENF